MSGKKKDPWRIILGLISIGFIVFMWVKKDIVSIYATMPQEQIIPMIATTVAVTVLKVALITGVILLIKWISGKFKTESSD